MKRSEAITEIFKIISKDYNFNMYDLNILCNAIIDALEKKGMQPPRDLITLRNEWKAE